MMTRVDTLPEGCRLVFEKIQHYLWKHFSGDGLDTVEAQAGLLELFEEGAAKGKDVLAITGPDVAAFWRTRPPTRRNGAKTSTATSRRSWG